MLLTLTVLAFSVVFFATGRLRSDIVALCALTTLLFAGVLTPEEALAGFSSSVVIMMIGLFVISGAILQTGLAKVVSEKIVRLSRGKDMLTFLLIMLTTSVIGAFVSNTGTVALMMPIIVSMATQQGKSPSRFLMPMAFASSMGGMLTLIGTPPNLIISEALEQGGYEPLKFFSFMPVGIIVIVIGILVLLPLSRAVLDKKEEKGHDGKRKGKTMDDLVREYSLQHTTTAYRIAQESDIKGKTIAEIDFAGQYGLQVLEIRQEQNVKSPLMKKVRQQVAKAKSRLHAGDIIYVQGDADRKQQMAKDFQLSEVQSAALDFYEIGMTEIVLMPGSRLDGTRIKHSGLRESFGINVIGIRRSGNYITNKLGEVKLQVGDALLVQGTWQNINRLEGDATDWVVLGRSDDARDGVLLNYKAPLAAAIMLLMIAMMVFDFIPVAPVTAVMIAGLLVVLTGCLRSVEAAYKTINWQSIVLIAAMMPMSTALEKTGTSQLLSNALVDMLGGMGPMVLLGGIYFATSLLTMFISNTATAVLMTPIAFTAATQSGVSPYPFLFAVTLGASMCFASPFSTPPNVLVMKAGNYSFMDYVRVGLPLQFIIGVVMTFVLPLLFPF